MIWTTWRQFRAQSIATGAFVAAFAIALLVTGLSLNHLYGTSGLATCHGAGACQTLASNFLSEVKGGAGDLVFYLGIGIMYAVPGLIGMFWGAPLVAREAEAGTFRLAWTQSVSRSRWLAAKLGLIGLIAVGTTGLLSLMISWWSGPIYHAAGQASGGGVPSIYRFAPALFGAQGIVPLGYAAFAFTLGVTAGLLIRRTVPAMAVTLAGFAFVQLAWPTWVRPHLMSPLRSTTPLRISAIDEIEIINRHNSDMIIGARVSKPGAWILSNTTISPDGHQFTGPATQACQGSKIQACDASIARLHLRQLLTYQPANRFWTFQWYELAIFGVLALLLAGFCAWRVRHRRA